MQFCDSLFLVVRIYVVPYLKFRKILPSQLYYHNSLHHANSYLIE